MKEDVLMKLWYWIPIIMIGLLIVMTSCRETTSPTPGISVLPMTSPIQSSTLTVPVIPDAPKVGMATIMGIVADRETGALLANVPVRLAEVYRQNGEGVYVLDGAFSPGDLTDTGGRFVIENFAAGEYVIVVGNVEYVYEIITEQSGAARVWDFPSGQVTDVGILWVTLGSW